MNAESAGFSVWIVLLALGAMIFWVLVAIGIFLAVRRGRELRHLEKMKAIEHGLLPTEGPSPSKVHAEMITSIAVGVPAVTFSLAFVGTIFGAGPFAWPSAAGTSAVAVICATVLSALGPRNAPAPTRLTTHSKPNIETDAYDVVGSRG
jgi:hypothetical protein